jgi:hypothetical protein
MRVDPPLFVTGGSPGAAAAPKPATPFSQVLTEDGQVPAVAPAVVRNRDADDATPSAPPAAFAFGALGLFAPARGVAGGTPDAALSGPDDAAAPPVEPRGPGGAPALAVRLSETDAASASPGSDPTALATAPAAAGAATPAPRAAIHASAAASGRAASLAESAEPESSAGAAPHAPRPAPRRTTAASLMLAEVDGRLSVAAAARGLDAAGRAEVRARLNAAAAEAGARLDDLHINGDAGAAPAKGGPRHGHRAR